MKIRGQSGQATIEFALVIIFLLSATFLVLQASLMYAYGNFVQYATFMAARSYLSAGAGDAHEQEERALATLRALLKKNDGATERWPGLATTQGLEPATRDDVPGAEIWGVPGSGAENAYQIDTSQENYSWLIGVRYRFRGRLVLLDLGQKSVGGKGRYLELVSESWLGRDPGDRECIKERSKRAQTLGRPEARLLLDNGC